MPNDLKLWEALFESSDELISTYSSIRTIAYTTVEALMKFTDLALVGCKKKTRKKNLNRAMKIMAKERNSK